MYKDSDLPYNVICVSMVPVTQSVGSITTHDTRSSYRTRLLVHIFFSHGATWGFNTEHTIDHVSDRPAKPLRFFQLHVLKWNISMKTVDFDPKKTPIQPHCV